MRHPMHTMTTPNGEVAVVGAVRADLDRLMAFNYDKVCTNGASEARRTLLEGIDAGEVVILENASGGFLGWATVSGKGMGAKTHGTVGCVLRDGAGPIFPAVVDEAADALARSGCATVSVGHVLSAEVGRTLASMGYARSRLPWVWTVDVSGRVPSQAA